MYMQEPPPVGDAYSTYIWFYIRVVDWFGGPEVLIRRITRTVDLLPMTPIDQVLYGTNSSCGLTSGWILTDVSLEVSHRVSYIIEGNYQHLRLDNSTWTRLVFDVQDTDCIMSLLDDEVGLLVWGLRQSNAVNSASKLSFATAKSE